MKKRMIGALLILLTTLFLQVKVSAQVQPAKPLEYVIVPPEGGYQLGTGKWKLTTNNTGGSIAICEFNNKDTTDWNWVSSHVHTREDEIWYVLEGELTFRINNQMRSAGPGSLVFGPRNMMHAYRVSKAPVKYLLMLTPAGIDLLFPEVDSVSKRFPRGSAEFRKRIALLSEKYGAYHKERWDSIMNTADLTNGTWELDIAASVFKPGPGWKKQTRIYTSDEKNIKMIATGIRENGESTRFEYTGAYDGKDYPVTGNPKVETIAQDLIDKYTVTTKTKRDGKITAVSIRVISMDGKTMTITTSGTDEKGVAFYNTLVLRRQ
ncbi:MAG TPA: cupin domain-containing protein [Chitinophagaceae bacterium]|jgi:quercetin dioxygenase-like cupin family protein|nr:cupin domain-containing protein [Chitinophagaceae bacterium]